jgi:hypothetical protein
MGKVFVIHMSCKIFISYRRQDSGANAIAIGQYLENEFGRENVFIDIDMHAGAKFPMVLEQRLAECMVMLVLIGPEWLNARDEQGHRRLDDSDDWVRLEIAHALKRDITVIPVLVNGAELPRKAELPGEILGLLDHQAASVTMAGFRDEMSGLVYDIRSISKPRRWRQFGAEAIGLLLLASVLVLAQDSGLSSALRLLLFPPMSKVPVERDIWRGEPGEFVLFQVSANGIPFYFKPSSVKTFGDKVEYMSRFLLEPDKSTSQNFQDEITVVDCKKSIWALAERTAYNKSGYVLTHFKWGDLHSLDLSNGDPIKPGSILSIAAHIMCDGQLRTPILSKEQVAKLNFSYLTSTPTGDGDIFYGAKKAIPNSTYPYEFEVVIKLHQNHKLAELFNPKPVVGLTDTYRSFAEVAQLNCKDWKVLVQKMEYFNSENNLVNLNATTGASSIDAQESSSFDLLLNVGCGTRAPQVHGTYEGTNDLTTKDGNAQQKISIVIEQNGKDVSVSFETPSGGQGRGTGALTGETVNSILLKSTAPGCPGSYEASLKFADDTVSWTYKGQDCGGPVEGHGIGKKT